MNDAIIISDLHLGSNVCQDKQLRQFLHQIKNGEIKTRLLILNGDVFDSLDFHKLSQSHWKVLSLLRKISKQLQVVWINGNHDGPSEIISHLLGTYVIDEFEFKSGDKQILCLHGHRFDDFLSTHPIITCIADWLYGLLQQVHLYWAHRIKLYSKTFLRASAAIEKRARLYKEKKQCDIVITSHTHLSVSKLDYFNTGCWTEEECHYITVLNGKVELHKYEPK